MSNLREQVLTQEVQQLRQALSLVNKVHFSLLTTIVHYCGGELTLTKADFESAIGLILTEEDDAVLNAKTWRVKRVGKDGGASLAPGGLLPPQAGQRDFGEHL